VREGDDVNLKKRPTIVNPVYNSKKQYDELLREHVAQLRIQPSAVVRDPVVLHMPSVEIMTAPGEFGA